MSKFQPRPGGYLKRKHGVWGQHRGIRNAHLSAFMERGAESSEELTFPLLLTKLCLPSPSPLRTPELSLQGPKSHFPVSGPDFPVGLAGLPPTRTAREREKETTMPPE